MKKNDTIIDDYGEKFIRVFECDNYKYERPDRPKIQLKTYQRKIEKEEQKKIKLKQIVDINQKYPKMRDIISKVENYYLK